MNRAIREAVRKRLKERNWTQAHLAELARVERPNVTRLLSGTSGKVSANWQRVLDVLDLELVAVTKEAAHGNHEGSKG